MTEPVLRVLLLEDSARDADMVMKALDQLHKNVVFERIDSEEAFENALVKFPADVVLADRPLSRQKRACTYSLLRSTRPAAPVIALLNQLDEQSFFFFLRDGPDDLVLKSNLGRLRSAVQNAIEARKPLAKLSPRQLEVLLMVAEGRSTRAIADQLKLSVKTVESHRGAMMKRLGLHDVAGLVRYAVRMGLVSAGKYEDA